MKLKNIYIHIPFCKKKCSFCDFSIYAVGNNCFKDSQQKKNFDDILSEDYVEKLIKEINFFGRNFGSKDYPLKSIYFGGGTPTLLNPLKIEKIINSLSKYFSFNSRETEISIESDPNTFDNEKLNYLTDNIGFNRITMGVQSLDSKVFRNLNRSHSLEDTLGSIDLIQQSKFKNNFGLDLIQGLPDQTLESAISDIKFLNNLDIPHLSVYMLSLENKSSLFRKYEKEYNSEKKQNEIADMFCFTHEFLSNNHYEQYEISNFSKDSKYSVHNKSYWDGVSEFYGFGSSSSSFFLNKRFKKPKSIIKYYEFVDNITKGINPEFEFSNYMTKFNENKEFNQDLELTNLKFLLLNQLRRREGINLNDIKMKFNENYYNIINDYFTNKNCKYLSKENDIKYLISKNNNVFVKFPEGALISDEILVDLYNFIEVKLNL